MIRLDNDDNNNSLRIQLGSAQDMQDLLSLLSEDNKLATGISIQSQMIHQIHLEFLPSFSNRTRQSDEYLMANLFGTLASHYECLIGFTLNKHTTKPDIPVKALKEFFAHAPSTMTSFELYGAVSLQGTTENYQDLAQTLGQMRPQQLQVFKLLLHPVNSGKICSNSGSGSSNQWDVVLRALLSKHSLKKLAFRPPRLQTLSEETTHLLCSHPPPDQLLLENVYLATSNLQDMVQLARNATKNLRFHFYPWIEGNPSISQNLRQWILQYLERQHQQKIWMPSFSIPITRKPRLEQLQIHFAVPPKLLLDRVAIRQALVLGLLPTSEDVFVGKVYRGTTTVTSSATAATMEEEDGAYYTQQFFTNNKKISSSSSSCLLSLFGALERHNLWSFDPQNAASSSSSEQQWMQFLQVLGQLDPQVHHHKEENSSSATTIVVQYNLSYLYSFLQCYPMTVIRMGLRDSTQVQQLKATISSQAQEIQELKAQIAKLQQQQYQR